MIKKEVDFLVTIDDKPWFAVEVNLSDISVASSLIYFKDRLEIPYTYQVVRKPGIDYIKKGVRVLSADRFLAALL